jgi:hypothetical protein
VANSEVSEALEKAKALKLRKGLIVRSLDGRSFFLTEEDIRNKALAPEAEPTIARMFKPRERTLPKGYMSCDDMLKWLLENDPYTEVWRGLSVAWINGCTK